MPITRLWTICVRATRRPARRRRPSWPVRIFAWTTRPKGCCSSNWTTNATRRTTSCRWTLCVAFVARTRTSFHCPNDTRQFWAANENLWPNRRCNHNDLVAFSNATRLSKGSRFLPSLWCVAENLVVAKRQPKRRHTNWWPSCNRRPVVLAPQQWHPPQPMSQQLLPAAVVAASTFCVRGAKKPNRSFWFETQPRGSTC